MTIFAAIDAGTNSFHLVVAESAPNGSFTILTRERENVRLGSGASDMNELSENAMDRGIQALQRLKRLAHDSGASKVTTIATSAIREAENGKGFIARAEQEAGLRIDVVSGTEEARLIHLGVLQALDFFSRQHLVVDIGGGSTEFVVAKEVEPLLLRSLKIGAIRLSDRFFPNGVSTRSSVDDCRSHIESFLGPLSDEITEVGFEVAAGSSGTIRTLAKVSNALNGNRAYTTGSLSLHQSDLTTLVTSLGAMETPEERSRLPGLDERRSDIIVAGGILLDVIMQRLRIKTLEVSEFALREGILLEEIRRASDHSADPLRRLSQLRRSSVMTVAGEYCKDLDHVLHVTDLALQLFDGLAEVHHLGAPERELFEAAGILHNVGTFISHSAHHRHSYYLIRNSDRLLGFTENEIEMVAQVARYHRKSGPKARHPDFASLNEDEQLKVTWMAAMLRVAIGLDRSNSQLVKAVSVSGKKKLQITVQIRKGKDASIDLYSARERLSLLEHVVGSKIGFREGISL